MGKMNRTTISLGGDEYVILRRHEYDRLTTLARAADLPPLPKPDRSGNVPALAYASASLARKIIKARSDAGLTQRELARRAGISCENLCRIERGRHTPNVASIVKIERALADAVVLRRKRSKTRS